MSSFTDLIKRVLNLYSQNFSRLLGALVILIAWNVLGGFLMPTPPQPPTFTLPLAGLVLLISFLVSAYTELALVGIFSRALEGATPSLKDALLTALRRFPKFLLILILWGLLIAAGTLFLIIPAIIFGVWFMFVSCAYLIEGAGIRAAFSRSRALTRGSFFPLFWRLAGVILLVMFVISAAGEGILAISRLVSDPNLLPGIQTASNLVSGILSALFLPLITGTIVTLYYEMKKIKG